MATYARMNDTSVEITEPINPASIKLSYGSRKDSGAGVSTKDKVFWEYMVILKANQEGSKDHTDVLDALRGAELFYQQAKSRDGDEILIRVGATADRLETEAERIEIKIPLRDFRSGKGSAADLFQGNGDLIDAALGVAPFVKSEKEKFERQNEDDDGCFFRSARRQQLLNSIISAPLTEGGCDIDFTKLLHQERVVGYFPLHDYRALDKLKAKWIGSNRDLTKVFDQPMRDIRFYFGEYVALYFSWLAFYTRWLILPSIVGTIAFIIQLADEFDTPAVAAYCIFVSLWATFFLEFWKREQAGLAFKWDTQGIEEDEKPRPQFKGEKIPNKVTGEEEEAYPQWKRTAKYFISYPMISTLLAGVVVATLGILTLRIYISKSNRLGESLGPMIAGILNAVTIVIFDQLYLRFARRLNDWENYRTQTEYDDALIMKNFLFQFINSYVSLFYLAFVKINDPTIFGVEDECINSCVEELTYQLASIFGVRTVTQQIVEFSLPQIKIFYRKYTEERALKEQNGESGLNDGLTMSVEEEQSKLENYHGAFDDYNEMIIQYGYVTLFAASFPLASLLALVNNIIEIRLDAFKMCTTFKRPHYRAAEDIGTYYYILEVISAIAVITNACLLSFTSEFLANEAGAESTLSHLWVAVIAEHILFCVKFLIQAVIPDVPEEVSNAIQLAKYNSKLGSKTAAKRSEEDAQLEKRKRILETPSRFSVYMDRSDWLRGKEE